MGGTSTPKFYWDTCIIIAHLKDEKRKHPASVPAIAKLMEFNERGRVGVIGSQMVPIEIHEWSLSDEQEQSLQAFYLEDNNELFDIDGRIAAMTREIRSYYKEHPIIDPNGNRRGIKVPDAVHLATAIIHEVDEFHTLDDGGQDGFSMLSLSGNVAGYNLKVCKPEDAGFLAIGGLFDQEQDEDPN